MKFKVSAFLLKLQFGLFSTSFAITAPNISAQTGELICIKDTFDRATIKADNALNRYWFPEKPICKLECRAPIRAKPASRETNACGKDWMNGTIFQAKTPNSTIIIPDIRAAIYRFDFGPESGPAQIAVIIPAILALCPPKNPAMIEKMPLMETILRMGGLNSELSNAAIPGAASLLRINAARGRDNVINPIHVNSGVCKDGKKNTVSVEGMFKS